LRARRERPRRRSTAEERDELAPSYVGHGVSLPSGSATTNPCSELTAS
jgi:hypothetical protein